MQDDDATKRGPFPLLLNEARSHLWLTPKSPRYPRPRASVCQPRPPPTRAACAQGHWCLSRVCSFSMRSRRVRTAPFCSAWLPWSGSLADPGAGHTRKYAAPFWFPRSCTFRHALQLGGSSFTCCLLAGLGVLSARVPMNRSTNPKETGRETGVVREAQVTPDHKGNTKM